MKTLYQKKLNIVKLPISQAFVIVTNFKFLHNLQHAIKVMWENFGGKMFAHVRNKFEGVKLAQTLHFDPKRMWQCAWSPLDEENDTKRVSIHASVSGNTSFQRSVNLPGDFNSLIRWEIRTFVKNFGDHANLHIICIKMAQEPTQYLVPFFDLWWMNRNVCWFCFFWFFLLWAQKIRSE